MSDRPAREWDDLPKEQRAELLIEYGHYLDQFPRTCDIDEKNRRFVEWLAQRSIHYRPRP